MWPQLSSETYIISVNALIVSDSGRTCVGNNGGNTTDVGCFIDPSYADCLAALKLDLITATAAIACLSTLLMGLFVNLPLGLAPGMGLNAYFTYTVVGFHGANKITYETALAAVSIEGIIFLYYQCSLVRLIPQSTRIATGAGIGLFSMFIGVQSSAGIGLIGNDEATLVALSGCVKDAKGAVLLGILFVSILSWIRGTTFTYFPYIESGDAMFDYFKQVVTFHPIQNIMDKMDFQLNTSEIWIALITFLYVNIMDTTGTLYSMAKFRGYMERNGDFEGSSAAFLCDAASISLGAVFGLPPVTAYIESGAGITEGGKTRLTAIFASILFFISLFFTPIFASFPPWATGPALIIVGSMMIKSVRSINWDNMGDAIPAFLAIALMPLTYSIAYGLIAGYGSYIAINGGVYLIELISGDRLKPEDKDLREPWPNESFTLESVLPPWVQKLVCKTTGQTYVSPRNRFEEQERLEKGATSNSEKNTTINIEMMKVDSTAPLHSVGHT
ncbi:hypothetical protein BGX27_003080 [Mortierella sp. AM989]|nr:hypothetical protein BGX27_003080 [Mortierella sp. AM989]